MAGFFIDKKIQLLIASIAVLSVALLYFFYDARLPQSFWPQCPFNVITKLYCPGCGTQRALSSLLHGNIKQAVGFNCLAVFSLPLLIYAAIIFTLNTWRKQQTELHVFYTAWFPKLLLMVVLLFWVLRNIAMYPFKLLAPHY